MSASVSVAATLSFDTRQAIGVQVLAQTEPISHIASAHQVSHKFVYQQGDKAQQAWMSRVPLSLPIPMFCSISQ